MCTGSRSDLKSSVISVNLGVICSFLVHLQHNQESDLDPLKTHTSLGQHTNTKNVDRDPLKNTHHFSANTQKKLVQQNTRITLVTEENLKSIQAEILSHTLCSISISKQSQLFENQKLVVLKRLLFLKSVFLNLFKDVCYQILTKLFIAFKDWSKH